MPKTETGRWPRSHRARRLVLILSLAGAVALLALRGFDTYLGGLRSIGSLDFLEYWSAARLAMEGGNPYDGAALLEVERAVGWSHDRALMMWNPPWTLALVMPVALLPFDAATFVWLMLRVCLVLGAGFLLWRYFAPRSRHQWMGMLLPVGFFPTWSALLIGQISPWVLIGVVGFLWAERKGWDYAAGACLSLLTIKPHVIYLFLLAALWWTWQKRRWGILIGWVSALTGANVLVLVVDSDVFTDYLAAAANPPLAWQTPTFGLWLRMLTDLGIGWLQFVPSMLGGLGLVVWLWHRRGPWRWAVLSGPLLLGSVVTASYGWSHDQVVLLPAVVALVAGMWSKQPMERVAILVLLAGAQMGLAAMSHWGVSDGFALWHAPLLAGLHWWATSGERAGSATARRGCL